MIHSCAERFLPKTLNATHTQTPRVVNVDKNAAYPPALLDALKANKQLPKKRTTAAGKVFQQPTSAARPSLAQTTDKTRNGIWLFQYGTTNFERH